MGAVTNPQHLRATEEGFDQKLLGKRLICEVDFDEERIQEYQDILQQLRLTAWNDFPCVAAVTTVGVGIYYYKSGTYWDHWPWLSKPTETRRWGEKFEQFLKRHPSLETFDFLIEEERALRFVARILGHGGVPFSCLDELFELITRYGSVGESGEELLDYFRNQMGRLGIGSVPLKRFIEHCGEVAEDLIGRLVTIRDSREANEAGFGLPPHILRAFRGWRQKHQEVITCRRARFPTPMIRLDPRTYRLDLRLPRCDDHPDAGTNWLVAGITAESNRATSLILQEPRESWKVVNGQRRFVFKGITGESPVLFFEPRTGRLIREPEKRRLPERVWAIVQEGIEIDVQPDDNEPYEPWPGFRMVSINLEDTKNLKVGDRTYEVRRPFFRGEMEPLPFIHSREGLPVLSSPPSLDWLGDANLSVERDRKPRGDIDLVAEELPELLTVAGEYSLVLRGPLGQRESLHFVFVPGLQIGAKPSVMLPNTPSIQWAVLVPEGSVLLDGETHTSLMSSKPELSMEIGIEGRRLPFLLAVPKLEWSLSILENLQEDVQEEWSPQPLSASISQLRDDLFPNLIVRLPHVSLTRSVEIALVNPERGERLTTRPVTVQRDRVWRFDIRQARAWCETSGELEKIDAIVQNGELTIYRGRILEIRPEWDLNEETFNVTWKKDDSEHVITWEWEESGPCSSGRWLALESCWQPWEEPVMKHQLQPDERGRFELHLPLPKLRPGRYRATAIHAPWGLHDVASAKPLTETTLDVYKEAWPMVFSIESETPDFRSYLEALAAHWSKPELVPYGPVAPSGLAPREVRGFLKGLLEIGNRCNALLPRDWDESLSIYWKNPDATLDVFDETNEDSWLWRRTLPDADVLRLTGPTQRDRELLRRLVLEYRDLATSPAAGKRRRSQRSWRRGNLLRYWKRMLDDGCLPPLGELLFLCERFQVVDDNAAPTTRSEYEILKSGHERMLGHYRRSEW